MQNKMHIEQEPQALGLTTVFCRFQKIGKQNNLKIVQSNKNQLA
jgi:hypothetical protein